jgi:hypothetical protein
VPILLGPRGRSLAALRRRALCRWNGRQGDVTP